MFTRGLSASPLEDYSDSNPALGGQTMQNIQHKQNDVDLKSLIEGQSLGVFPQDYLLHYTDVFSRLYPEHHLTVIAQGDEAHLLVYPPLGSDELMWWEQVLDDVNRKLER